jgi:lipopolysaccharide export system permease protein
MRSLFFYVMRQIVGPSALFTVVLALVVWMTQSLRLLDLVINRAQSTGVFAYLTMLMLPSLLVVIVPIAFFGATLYALNKLNSDSELVVMWSAGISRLQLALPVIAAAAVAMAVTYACSLYLMPLGQRIMNDKLFDIRTDIGAAILREGAFTTPNENLTVFVRELAPNGEIHGIMVHDNRQPQRPVTYLAEAGLLAQTPAGARLIMINGNIEEGEAGGSRLSVLRFDRYVFDLDQFAGSQRGSERDTSERYLSELFNPPPAGTRSQVLRAVYLAEAHNRISAPLYCLAFALIALAATAKGPMARGSYALRLSGAALMGAALRLVGYAAQGLAARNPQFLFLLYLLPLAAVVIASAILHDVRLLPEAIRRLFRAPVEQTA